MTPEMVAEVRQAIKEVKELLVKARKAHAQELSNVALQTIKGCHPPGRSARLQYYDQADGEALSVGLDRAALLEISGNCSNYSVVKFAEFALSRLKGAKS